MYEIDPSQQNDPGKRNCHQGAVSADKRFNVAHKLEYYEMIERPEERFDVKPDRLIGDMAVLTSW